MGVFPHSLLVRLCFHTLAVLTVVLPISVWAQDKYRSEPNKGPIQERKMADRLLNWDMSLEFRPADRGFIFNKKYNDGKPAYVKDFYINQKPHLKSYRTKPWWGAKADPALDKKFKTKDARTKTYKTEQYKTEQYKTEEWWAAKKATPVKDYATGNFSGRGTAQGALDDESAVYNKPMTIDDVRTLLNKNK